MNNLAQRRLTSATGMGTQSIRTGTHVPILWLIMVSSGLFILAGYASDPSLWPSLRIVTQVTSVAPPVVTTPMVSPQEQPIQSKNPVLGFTAMAGHPGEIDLAWTLPANNDYTSLTVFASGNNGNTWTPLAAIAPTATSYIVKGLDTTHPYNFQLRAKGAKEGER